MRVVSALNCGGGLRQGATGCLVRNLVGRYRFGGGGRVVWAWTRGRRGLRLRIVRLFLL